MVIVELVVDMQNARAITPLVWLAANTTRSQWQKLFST